MRAGLVTWLVLVHATAVFLFSHGFLLSRLALSDVVQPHHESSPPPHPTHQRAVILIVDSLRFDFLSPHPPEPLNPYHHHVLTLPAELTKLHPEHSFLFNAYADPPTTTLQRIKALTTGSLPTFVDMGSNFGGSAILEDSIVKQLVLANKSVRRVVPRQLIVPVVNACLPFNYVRSHLWATTHGSPSSHPPFIQTSRSPTTPSTSKTSTQSI